MSNQIPDSGPPDDLLALADTMPDFSHFEKVPGGGWRAVSESDAGEWAASRILPKLEQEHGPFPKSSDVVEGSKQQPIGDASPDIESKGVGFSSRIAELRDTPMTKRDFTRSAGMVMGAAAFGIYMGVRKIKGAAAVTCWFFSQATRYSSSCPTLQSCWFTLHCSDGTVRVYRAYCGRCTAQP